MNITDLFRGVAVIIDDEIGKKDANINDLIKQIEGKNIPNVQYTEIPHEDTINHLQNISFLLLDWRLVEIDEMVEEGVYVPATTEEENVKENLKFLEKLLKKSFVPIFIFTTLEPRGIIRTLSEAGLFKENEPNFIFVKRKSELTHNKLFNEIERWISQVPSVYVLKEWEREYGDAKSKLFYNFFNINPSWPYVLWKNFNEPGVDTSKELGDVISRNLYSRMVPFSFEAKFIENIEDEIGKEEIRNVLEGERYLSKSNLSDNEIGTGDVFREEYKDSASGENKHRYYLNIRAQCDMVRSTNIDSIELYCLRGRVFDESKINQEGGISLHEGQFIEKINHALVPFIDNGKIIEFLFKDLKIKKWKDLENLRIGRLLKPHITRIQQRYALYMIREGLPSMPQKAISDN